MYGQKDGYESWYYSNGNKKSETLYENGKVLVPIIRWDINGGLIKE